jgi:hypothetical protein
MYETADGFGRKSTIVNRVTDKENGTAKQLSLAQVATSTTIIELDALKPKISKVVTLKSSIADLNKQRNSDSTEEQSARR